MKHELTDRGFKHMEPITDQYQGIVSVYESSVATEPCLWVSIQEHPSVLTRPSPGLGRSHMTLGQARQLRDQLDWLIEHHYQNRK